MAVYEYRAWVDWHDPDDPFNRYHIGPYPTLDDARAGVDLRIVADRRIAAMRRVADRHPEVSAHIAIATPEVKYEQRMVVQWEPVPGV